MVINTNTVYSSGDNIFVRDEQIITVDQSITSTNWISGVNAEVVWANPPAASYTFTCTNFWWGCDVAFRYGSSGSRIPYAVRGTIAITTYQSVLPWWYQDMPHEMEVWGEIQTPIKTTISSTAALGQKNIICTDDVSSWVNGDTIVILGAAAYESRTIDSVAGSTITVTTNLTYAHTAGWAVFNATRCERMGCILKAAQPNAGYGYFSKFNISGVKLDGSFIYFIAYGNAISGISPANLASIAPFYIDSLYVPTSSNCAITVTAYAMGTVDTTSTELQNGGATFSNIINLCAGVTSPRIVYTTCARATINGLYTLEYVMAMNLVTTNCTISNVQHSSASWGSDTTYYAVRLVATGCTISNVKLTRLPLHYQGAGNTISNMTGDGGVRAIVITGPVANATFSNCSFGTAVANTSYSLTLTPTFVQALFNNCVFDATPVDTASLAQLVSGSYLKAHAYGGAANNHRSWWQYGYMVSSGDGLADTTVHTAGAGKFTIRFEPTSSANTLEWQFAVPTGDISTKTMTVAVWCRINAAAYYAGTHQKPRLTVNYDNGTVAYAEAAGSTGWQLLSVSFVPTTAYGQITVTLSARTDATGSNAYVYWDDFAALYPASYKLDLGGLDLWADALPVVPPIATVISAMDVWAALLAGMTGAGTMGQALAAVLTGRYAFNKATGVETISDAAGNVVSQRTVTDTETTVTKA